MINDKEMNEYDREREEIEKWNDNNWIWTCNNIGAEGTKMLSEGLKSNSTLTELNLTSVDNWKGNEWIFLDSEKREMKW